MQTTNISFNYANVADVNNILEQLKAGAAEGKGPVELDDIGQPLDELTEDWSLDDRIALFHQISLIFVPEPTAEQQAAMNLAAEVMSEEERRLAA